MCRSLASYLKLFQENNYILIGTKIITLCLYCGDFKIMTKDHIIPKSRGGCNARTNIALVCQECNGFKSDLSISDFRDKLKKAGKNHYFVQFCIDRLGLEEKKIVSLYNFFECVDRERNISCYYFT